MFTGLLLINSSYSMFLNFINKLSVFGKIRHVLLAWQKSSNAGTVRGGVSPTVRDRGKCSWPNVHSLAPPSPTACTERVGGLYTYYKQAHTHTVQNTVQFKLTSMHGSI